MDKDIIWITYRGRRIPIKKGMKGYENKNKEKIEKTYSNNSEYVKKSIEANKSEGQKLLDTVEKNKAGKEYRDKLNKISDKSIPDGTYDVDTGKAVDFKGEGYNVSFEQSGVKLSNDEYYDAIEECRNKCDGKVYAGKFGGDPEISFYTKDKKVALELMEKYNQHSIWDNSIGDIIENPKYDESKNKVNYKPTESAPTRVRSTKKEVVDKIRKHIMDYYDSPEDLVRDMDAAADPRYDGNSWKKGSRLVDGGSFLIYNGDMSEELNKWGINPTGKKYSEDKSFNMYKSLVGREAGKIYDEYKRSQSISKLRTLSDIEQYYIEQGYSKATALKKAKEEINKRKRK